MNTTHPVAKIFAPAVFASLAFLTLGFSLGTAQAEQSASIIVAPKIERFDLDAPQRLAAGEALIFRISGTPRANASVSIAGVKQKIALREVMTGVYEGAYTIKRDDRIDVDSVVTGHLSRGNQDIAAVLGQPLVDVSALAGLR